MWLRVILELVEVALYGHEVVPKYKVTYERQPRGQDCLCPTRHVQRHPPMRAWGRDSATKLSSLLLFRSSSCLSFIAQLFSFQQLAAVHRRAY